MPKAIRMYETGGPEVLKWEKYAPDKPGPGEALVRHEAVGVNFIDISILSAKGSLFLTRPSLMTYTAKREDLLAHARDLFRVVAEGAVKVEIRQTYPLSEAARVHRDIEARRTTGSTILLPA